MKGLFSVATGIGVIFCALAANHQSGLTKPAASWTPLTKQSAARLAGLGKQLVQQKGCNTCHGADLQGKPHFAPGLRARGPMRHYNTQTFARLMASGITDDGGKVKKPMPVYHLKAHDSLALYTYLKTLK